MFISTHNVLNKKWSYKVLIDNERKPIISRARTMLYFPYIRAHIIEEKWAFNSRARSVLEAISDPNKVAKLTFKAVLTFPMVSSCAVRDCNAKKQHISRTDKIK